MSTAAYRLYMRHMQVINLAVYEVMRLSRVGEKIKIARLEKNVPLKQIAKKCGVSESYLSEVESGRRIINDEMIKKISSILNLDLNEPIYIEEDEEERHEEKSEKKRLEKSVSPEWQSAFSNIIKDIPVYDVSLGQVLGVKRFPIVDKKVEGYNPDKLIFIQAPDNSLSAYRVKKGDLVMALLNNEMVGSGLTLVEYNGGRAVRYIKRLEGEKVLVISSDGSMKTETLNIHEIKILAHCIRAEIDLTNI